MTTSRKLWLAWVASFVVLEGLALARGRDEDTFTAAFHEWFRVGDPEVPTWLTWALRIPLLGFGVWLVGHLVFGLWGVKVRRRG